MRIYILMGFAIVFLIGAACYEHPGLGWRWEEDYVSRVLNIYDRVRLDLSKYECRTKKGQVLVKPVEVGSGS